MDIFENIDDEIIDFGIEFAREYRNTLELKWKNYLESKKWECSSSPFGAHYFICQSIKYEYPILYQKEVCKYCGKVKKTCSRI